MPEYVDRKELSSPVVTLTVAGSVPADARALLSGPSEERSAESTRTRRQIGMAVGGRLSGAGVPMTRGQGPCRRQVETPPCSKLAPCCGVGAPDRDRVAGERARDLRRLDREPSDLRARRARLGRVARLGRRGQHDDPKRQRKRSTPVGNRTLSPFDSRPGPPGPRRSHCSTKVEPCQGPLPAGGRPGNTASSAAHGTYESARRRARRPAYAGNHEPAPIHLYDSGGLRSWLAGCDEPIAGRKRDP